MSRHHKPRSGSKAYSPRVRAKKQTPNVNNYPTTKEVMPLGFPCYKAGMTHVITKGTEKNNPTYGLEVQVPVTILDCPPLSVFGARAYLDAYLGLEALAEVYAEKLDKDLARAMQLPKKVDNTVAIKKIEANMKEVAKFTLLVHTQPRRAGVHKKKPDIMELGVGGTVEEQWAYCKKMLGKEISVKDVFKELEFVDAVAVTKGKGYQGPVKRWGITMQKRKHMRSGHMRHVGAMGVRGNPSQLKWMIPQAGKMGYHRRTDFNKLVVKIGEKGDEITPKGGFVGYGLVTGAYILLKGTVPGPRQRVIVLRKSVRALLKVAQFPIEHISTVSQQGT